MKTLALETTEVARLAERIRGEYLEMPGLSLTLTQAQRLRGLDETRCQGVLGALMDAQFLARTPSGAFVRAASAPESGALPSHRIRANREVD